MKIIANTEDGYLIQASGSELANLWGFRSIYAEGFSTKEMTKLNAEIDIAGITKAAELVRTMDKVMLKNLTDKLTEVQGQVATMSEIVSKLTIFEKLAT